MIRIQLLQRESWVWFITLSFALATSCEAKKNAIQLLQDPSFEAMQAGELPTTGIGSGWEVQRTGRVSIQQKLQVSCVANDDAAKSGQKSLFLEIPEETKGFEFVTVGQRVLLDAGKEYEASVWVRWPAGQAKSVRTANGEQSMRPSAIISFWARHKNGEGTFAGRDDWLYDNRWKQLSFRFRAVDDSLPTFVYVSLLPNQKPVDTKVLIDDFQLREISDKADPEVRKHQLVVDHDFAKQTSSSLVPPWYFANMGGDKILGTVVRSKNNSSFLLAMEPATSNFESAQLWQYVHLQEGADYKISCRMRWDNFSPNASPAIVNYGIYHDESNTWYGPVDQLLEKNGDWNNYHFQHVPPYTGGWKLYVQLNGWGNFGSGVKVSIDSLECVADSATN